VRRPGRRKAQAVEDGASTRSQLVWPGFIVAVLGLVTVTTLGVLFQRPSTSLWIILKTDMALGAAGFSLALAGSVTVRLGMGRSVFISAASSFAVLVLMFFFNPADALVNDPFLNARDVCTRTVEKVSASQGQEVMDSHVLGCVRVWAQSRSPDDLLMCVENSQSQDELANCYIPPRRDDAGSGGPR
jgi:hypothetical protein